MSVEMKLGYELYKNHLDIDEKFRQETGEHFSDYPFTFGGFCYNEGFKEGIECALLHLDQPDHDAEVLGYPDGEAPTFASKLWKLVNQGRER